MATRGGIEAKIDSMFGTSGDDDADDVSNKVIEGEGVEQQEQGDGTAQEPSTQGEQEAARGKPARQDANAQRDDNAGEGGAEQRRPQQRGAQGAQGDQPPQRRLPANNNGDLIDPNTGAVVARAGNERRFFEAARTAQQNVLRITNEFERVQSELEAFREAAAAPRELGLSPTEATNAMQWFAHWKKNPVEAATSVLTELRAMGYEVEGLGGAVDMGAIRKMVQEAVSPFQQDREAVQREQEIAQQVDTELNTLYTAMPWARGQQQEIMALLDADQTLTLREAALHLQAYALQHGYDLQKPLRPQVLAAQNNGGGRQQQAPQRPNAARMPAPSTTGDVPLTQRRVTSAGHERSNRDIVKEAMREAGLNIDNL